MTTSPLAVVPSMPTPQPLLPSQLTAPTADALHGWAVAVTSAGRAEALASPLRQRGAQVLVAPTLQIQPAADSPELMAATQVVLDSGTDVLVTTSGAGLRGWLEAADGWGVGEALRARLAEATVLARGAKAAGAVQEAGLVDAARGSADSTWHLLGQLLGMPLRGLRIAVVLHGAPVPDLTSVLRTAGADVVEVPVYRAVPPADAAGTERLLELIRTAQVQAVTLTSAAATTHLVRAAEAAGALTSVLSRFADEVTPCAIGPVAAAPLERLGAVTVQPEHSRLGALVHAVTDALQARSTPVRAAGHVLEVRGTGAYVDGAWRPLPPAPAAVLRVLDRRPGHVVSRPELLAAMPGASTDEHTVEMAVRRLRTGLGDARCVQNVMKRGYRLAVTR